MMQQRAPLTEPQELRAFISKLYVYLVDEAHIALNKVTHTHTVYSTYLFIYCILMFIFLSFPWQIYSDNSDDDPLDEIQLSPSQLRYFAREAQLTGDYQQALQYYQQVK